MQRGLEYGCFPIRGGGVSFRDVKIILDVFIEGGRETVRIASAPLLASPGGQFLFVQISAMQGSEDLLIGELFPVDLVLLRDGLCQVLGHDAYGLRPEPAHFVQVVPPALR